MPSEAAVKPKLMGLKQATASDMVRRLTEQALCEPAPYGVAILTTQGREHAVAMVRRHPLVETLLGETMGYR